MDVRDIIDAFGGYHDAGRRLGVARSTLALWEVEGIPPKRWQQIVAELRRSPVEITLDVLAGTLPSKPRATSRCTEPAA
jgi:hypothetical protein